MYGAAAAGLYIIWDMTRRQPLSDNSNNNDNISQELVEEHPVTALETMKPSYVTDEICADDARHATHVGGQRVNTVDLNPTQPAGADSDVVTVSQSGLVGGVLHKGAEPTDNGPEPKMVSPPTQKPSIHHKPPAPTMPDLGHIVNNMTHGWF
jgi:hypothetical protein